MSFSGDPFRVLGLPSGASEEEIKRAYRALAKRYHPDSAGESALPRFLAIQAAYDMLTGGPAKRKATPAANTRPATPESGGARASREAYRARRATPPPPREPAGGWWAGGRPKGAGPAAAGSEAAGGGAPAAGPARGRTAGPDPAASGPAAAAGGPGPAAARQNRSGPKGSTPPKGPARGGRTGAAGRSNAGTGPSAQASSSGPTDGPPPGNGGRPGRGTGRSSGPGPASSEDAPPAPGGRRNRPPKVATLGSTSYDDAPAEREPSWSGATWYGGSSGTYWTLNPKEYADPRKHGPEYLARARRGGGGAAADDTAGMRPEARTEDVVVDDEPAAQNDPNGPNGPRPASRASTAEPGMPGGPPSSAANPADAASDDAAPAFGDGLPRTGTTTARPPRGTRAAGWRYQQSTPTDSWRTRRPAESRGRAAPPRDTAVGRGPWPGDGAPGSSTWSTRAAPPPDGPGGTDATPRVGESAAPSFDWGSIESKVPRRLLLAALAWPPLGYLAGAAIGEATGCGRYAATCSDSAAALGTLVQPLLVLVLVLLPVIARPAAVASIATAVAAVIGAVLLSISGGARVPTSASAPFLIVILGLGYAVGLAISFSRRLPLPSWLARSS